MIIGNSPLPTDSEKMRPAAGLRTYQFLRPLVEPHAQRVGNDGLAFSGAKKTPFKISLVTIAMPECYEKEPEEKEMRQSSDFSHLRLSKNDPNLIKKIQKIHDEFHPDAIISVNTYPSYVAAQLESRAPLWADLNGWAMAEAQAQAYKVGSDNYLGHYYEMERTVLERADKISTVSVPQKFAVLGELAMLGRLNEATFGYKFAYSIANGTEWFEGEKVKKKEVEERNKKLFGKLPEDAFVVLWLGGYNTWVDEITLFKGVDEAMSKCKNLYFVSTGGGIEGLDNGTFKKFKDRVDKSKYKNRFKFLGWVDTADIPYIYKKAMVGLNVDRKCTETYTGARNRINEMMKFGLPVITTLGSEISREVEKIEAGVAVKSGKSDELSEAIIRMYKDLKNRHGYKLKQYAENGKKYVNTECNYEFLTRPLTNWLDNPRPAPDRGVRVGFGKKSAIRSAFQYLKDNGFKKFFKKVMQRIKR